MGVSDGVLTIGTDRIDLRGVQVDPSPSCRNAIPTPAQRWHAHAPPCHARRRRFSPGLAALAAGEAAAAVVALKAGRGDGLTPTGRRHPGPDMRMAPRRIRR